MLLHISEKAKKNIEIMDKVVSKKEYQPKYPRWDGTPSTWCVYAAYDIVKECGYDSSLIVERRGIGYTNANDMYCKIWASVLEGKIKIVETEIEAVQLANQGKIALIIAYNLKGGSGHVAVVRPQIRVIDMKKGIRITQAGEKNGTFWSDDVFKKYKELTHPLMVVIGENDV